jgi:hypothetical protein
MLSPIIFHGFYELLPDPVPIFGVAQVYKVHYNDPPQVPKPNLPSNLPRR